MYVENVEIAAPLLSKPLSLQIKNMGGRGLYDTKATKIKDSYSVMYEFKTPDGTKFLKTRNEVQVGLIDDDKNYFVYLNAETGEYNLVTNEESPVECSRSLRYLSLGFSYNEMRELLKSMFQSRVRWNIEVPPVF